MLIFLTIVAVLLVVFGVVKLISGAFFFGIVLIAAGILLYFLRN